jgi:uncharacterized membrane protein
MKRWFSKLLSSTFLVVMLLGSLLITWTSLVYFDSEELPPFVIERLPVRWEELWLASLQVHVVSALVTLPLCIVLTMRFMQRHKSWHRWLGRLAGLLVLVALVPSGIVLSFEAKGGALVTAGFLVSAGIVGFGMIAGVEAARRRQLLGHARAMRHVVAQMSVAVTSRALLLVLDRIGMAPDTAYIVALWVPVVGSAVIAELISGPFIFPHFAFWSTRSALNQPSPRSPS